MNMSIKIQRISLYVFGIPFSILFIGIMQKIISGAVRGWSNDSFGLMVFMVVAVGLCFAAYMIAASFKKPLHIFVLVFGAVFSLAMSYICVLAL